MKKVNEYCVCNLKVSPFATDKVELNGRLYHRDHLRQHLAKQLATAIAQPNSLVLIGQEVVN